MYRLDESMNDRLNFDLMAWDTGYEAAKHSDLLVVARDVAAAHWEFAADSIDADNLHEAEARYLDGFAAGFRNYRNEWGTYVLNEDWSAFEATFIRVLQDSGATEEEVAKILDGVWNAAPIVDDVIRFATDELDLKDYPTWYKPNAF